VTAVRAPWRRRVLVAAALLALVNAGVYAAYTLPRSLQEKSVAARMDVMRSEVQQQRQRVGALKGRADAMRTNARDVQQFYAGLGNKVTILSLREEIARTASELGLKVGSRTYSSEPVKGSDDLMRFEIRMPLSGTYAQLAGFLERMERSPHFVTVDQIQLQQRGQGERAEMSAVLSVFYRGVPEKQDAS
jgi:Tfp pilus assembly protein PilO